MARNTVPISYNSIGVKKKERKKKNYTLGLTKCVQTYGSEGSRKPIRRRVRLRSHCNPFPRRGRATRFAVWPAVDNRTADDTAKHVASDRSARIESTDFLTDEDAA